MTTQNDRKTHINGKYLARAMMYFSFFLYLVIKDLSIEEYGIDFLLFIGAIHIFLGWRFMINLEKTFK